MLNPKRLPAASQLKGYIYENLIPLLPGLYRADRNCVGPNSQPRGFAGDYCVAATCCDHFRHAGGYADCLACAVSDGLRHSG